MPKHLVNTISGTYNVSFDALVDATDKAWALSAGQGTSVAAVTLESAPAEASITAVATSNAPARGRGSRQ